MEGERGRKVKWWKHKIALGVRESTFLATLGSIGKWRMRKTVERAS